MSDSVHEKPQRRVRRSPYVPLIEKSKEEQDKWLRPFCMPTRECLRNFHGCFAKHRNALMLYLVLATFYDLKKKRAWPTTRELEDALPMPKQHRYRVLDELYEPGLVEYWRENVGRHRRRFYRMPYLDERGHITGRRQQPTWQEVLARADSEEFAWVNNAHVLKAQDYQQGDGYWGSLKRKARRSKARGEPANGSKKNFRIRSSPEVVAGLREQRWTLEDIEQLESEFGPIW